MSDEESELATELEALEAIFGNDYTLVDGGKPGSSSRVQIALHDESSDVRLRLVFSLPVGYPEDRPAVGVQSDSGLSGARRSALAKSLEETVEQNLGLPMMYTLHAAAQEWIETQLTPGDSNDNGPGLDGENDDGPVFETRDEEEERKIEAADERKFHGTPVTPETFAEWKLNFDTEMAAVEEARRKAIDSKAVVKLSGRELFVQNKAVVTEESESLWEEEADMYTEK